jgi:hypothetical protein
MAGGYGSCKRYKGKKGKKSLHSENVGNFYRAKPTMGDSEVKQYHRRRGHYGNSTPPDDGPLYGRFGPFM